MMRYLLLGFLIALISNVFAQSNQEINSILSENRKQFFDLSQQKIEEDKSKLQKDWINPIQYQYLKNYEKNINDKESDIATSTISINQPIFKSGGIYYSILYANATTAYTNLNLKLQKKTTIAEALSLLFQIKKIDLAIEKQKLLIANAQIDIAIKKEQVIYGVMDTSFLDNAIIDANAKQTTLVELEMQKQTLINSFATYSDTPYLQVELPLLDLQSQSDFLTANINIQKSTQDSALKYWQSKMITTQYLPSVNALYTHIKYHENPQEAKNDSYYGLSVTLALSPNFYNETQSARIEYLKAKNEEKYIQTQEANFYATTLEAIKSLDKKIDLCAKDIELYGSLLAQVKALYSVGMKTQNDVLILENAKTIKSFDQDVFKIEKQMQLLELYSKVN